MNDFQKKKSVYSNVALEKFDRQNQIHLARLSNVF